MPRDPHPSSIEALEHDDAVHGPAEPREEHRLLVELSKRYLPAGREHIERSRALPAVLAPRVSRRQPR